MEGLSGGLIAAVGDADGAGIGVCARVRVDMGRYCPPLEIGATNLVIGTPRGALGGLVGDNIGVAVGSVLAGCGSYLAS